MTDWDAEEEYAKAQAKAAKEHLEQRGFPATDEAEKPIDSKVQTEAWITMHPDETVRFDWMQEDGDVWIEADTMVNLSDKR